MLLAVRYKKNDTIKICNESLRQSRLLSGRSGRKKRAEVCRGRGGVPALRIAFTRGRALPGVSIHETIGLMMEA